ncbi:MAG TPA: hypothetical protein VK081_06220 [Planctomycetota bacterium]|nr:hypothetical protein [Planctomycetota bacterium]
MLTLFRAFLALFAASTCVIGGWAFLRSLDPPEAPRADAPADLRVEELQLANLPPALAPVPTATEASAPRAAAREPVPPVSFRIEGDAPAATFRVRSTWSKATVAVERLAPGSAPPAVHLPRGEYEATIEGPGGPANWLARVRFEVPASEPVTLAVRTGALTVHVRDAAGAPLARVPVLVARIDDPAWLAPVPERDGVRAPVTDRDGAVTFAPLGAGDYRVAVPGCEDAAVTVAVPEQTAVTLAATAARR